MLGWMLPSPADRSLLVSSGARRATPWLIAIMSFAMMIIAAAGLALAHGAGTVAASTQSRYSVQLPAGASQLDRIVALLRADRSVSAVEPVPEESMRETLAKWMGPAAASRDLPVPALVNFDLRPGADAAALGARLAAAVPGARLLAHRDSLAPLLGSLRALQWLAIGLVLLLAIATAAAVVLAARGSLDTHRFTIDVMHGIGATDVQITHLFQRRIATDALLGSVAGAAAAALVLAALAFSARYAGDFLGGAGLGPGDVVLLVLIPLAVTVLATVVGRLAVLSALRAAL